jgi:phosphatidylserine/phosphatidylglycerophosphate/cardiolipin synthase-like enzyme
MATVWFDGIVDQIILKLKEVDGAKICSAWFSSSKILQQLETMGDVELIIGNGNRDRFLPGTHDYDRSLADRIRFILGPRAYLYKGDRLLHHKFIILLSENLPVGVITGSYNLTEAASLNLENMVYINSPEIAHQYEVVFDQLKLNCWRLEELSG